MKNQNSRDTVFAALKLIEQLYIDGYITRNELLAIIRQNTTIVEYDDFVAHLADRETA